jgi:hypothetical protein
MAVEQGALRQKDVRNEGRTDYIYEKTGDDDKMSSDKSRLSTRTCADCGGSQICFSGSETGLTLRDVRNEDRTGYVYENTGRLTKCHAQTTASCTKMYQLHHKRQESRGLFGRKCTDYAIILGEVAPSKPTLRPLVSLRVNLAHHRMQEPCPCGRAVMVPLAPRIDIA